MTHPIDTAYVDVVLEPKSQKRFERDFDKTMDRIERNLEKNLKEIDEHFDSMEKEFDKQLKEMNLAAEKNFRALEKIVDNSMDNIEAEFQTTFHLAKSKFVELGDGAEASFDRVDRKFRRPLGNMFAQLGTTVGELGKAMGQLVVGIGGTIASNPLLALVVVLGPAVLALVAALSQLIGLVALLPSSLGVLLAAIVPLVLAFQNFGEAISAVASGDVEKIDEALKKLSPSAAFVAREFGRMVPLLREFQKSIQEAFFSKIIFDLTHFAMIVLPALRDGMSGVAGALGNLVHEFAVWMRQGTNLQEFQSLFLATARIIETLTAPLVRFAGALMRVVVHALPFVERLTQGFGNLLDRFSAFLLRAVNDGSFDKFLQDALDTVGELVDLAKALGGLLGTLFSGTEEAGHDFIKTLTVLTNDLNAFLKTADGKAAIELLIFSVQSLGVALKGLLEIFKFLIRVYRSSLLMLEDIGVAFTNAVMAVGNWVSDVSDWISRIPETIEEFLSSLPERVAEHFRRMFDLAMIAIGVGIGLLLYNFQILSGQIVDFWKSSPERAYNAMLGIIDAVSSVFTQAFDQAKMLVTERIEQIWAFIQSVPDRLKSLIPNFQGAGKSLIESFMSGFRAVGGFVGEVAGDIVGAIKSTLNRAIDKINQGISIVDDVLPGSLGRVPRLADGALVKARPGGILANIGEGREDEVVAPLSKLEGMIGKGQSIVFAPGAINLNFDTVPTEAEAMTAGKAVGQGILDILARQNARVQVRAI